MITKLVKTPIIVQLRRMPIYTKTGDRGTTSLYTGERLAKFHPIFEALGANDEATSHIGLSIEFCRKENSEKLNSLIDELIKVQCALQDLNSHIATYKDPSNATKIERTRFDCNGRLTAELESWIDSYAKVLPPLNNFILPSGGLSGASLHVARTSVRRSERLVQQLAHDKLVEEPAAIYLNRLSDYLFMAARFSASALGCQELIYKTTTQ